VLVELEVRMETTVPLTSEAQSPMARLSKETLFSL
jgi:hypothetical protein